MRLGYYALMNLIVASYSGSHFPLMYLERPNNQNQSEISNHKPLIVNTFQDLTHFGCFLMLPKFPHIFETYF